MRTRIVLLLLPGVLVALAAAGCSTRQQTGPDTVLAVGTGTSSAAPDRSRLSFGVTASAKSSAPAMNGASHAADRVITALKEAGAEDAELQTLQLMLQPRRDRNGKITSYTADQSIVVTTKRLDKVGDFIEAGSNAGANRVDGPSFMMSVANEARAAALSEAMDDAKARADTMAKASGRTLGRLVSATEGMALTNQKADRLYARAAAGVPSLSVYGIEGPPIQVGENELQTQVIVEYELR